MAWRRKPKPDAISERERTLAQELAHVTAEIKRLDSQLQRDQAQPRLRSTATPHGSTVPHPPPEPPPTPAPAPVPPPAPPRAAEPIFEDVRPGRLARPSDAATPEHYNELGVRKFDLPALWRRLTSQFRGPATTNPKLVSYLAAGGIQGLRPLRYEKRIARNRFLLLVIFLVLILIGVCWEIFRK